MPPSQQKPPRNARPRNRRRDDRTEYHTVVTIVACDQAGLQTYKGWLVDISAGGALVLCPSRVPNGKLYLQILLPKLSKRFVEADIVSSRPERGLKIAHRQPNRKLLGVRFAGYVTDPVLLTQLRAAANEA